MSELKTTTKWGVGRGSHSHVVYLGDNGFGATGLAAKHVHQVQFMPATPEQPEIPPQIDQMTGIVIDPGSPAMPAMPDHWVVLPDPMDGHTHEVVDYQTEEPKREEESDEEVVKECIQLLRTWLTEEGDARELAKTASDFAWGDQWDEGTKAKLANLDRGCLTINKIGKHLDEICGTQREQQTDFLFLANEDGDQRVADILNEVSKHITTQCNFQDEESDAFEDAATVGRGNFNLYVDFSKNLEGDIKIERFPWENVVYAPHDKKDLSDCEGAAKYRMFSLAKIKALFPKQAKTIQTTFNWYGDPERTSDPGPGKHYLIGSERYPYVAGDLPLVDIGRKEFQVIDFYRKIYETVSIATDGTIFVNLFGWKEKDIEQLKSIQLPDGTPALDVIEHVEQKIRFTKVAGGVLLVDEYPADLPFTEIPLVPIYAKKKGNKFKGKVADAIDSQRQVNYRHSQAVDIGNKMVAYGWFYDDATFANGEEEKFLKGSSKPGFSVKLNDINRPPVQVQGVKFPSEVVQLMQLDASELSEQLSIMAIPTGANQSGSHFAQQQRARLVGNEYLFGNLLAAKKQVGRLMIQAIQKYWPADRILRLIAHRSKSAGAEAPILIGGEPYSPEMDEALQELLQTQDLVNYDVTVSESPISESYRLGLLAMFKELGQGGMDIPPQIFLELSKIPKAQQQKLLAYFDAQAKAAAQAEAAKQNSEVQKTMIAHGQPGAQPGGPPQGA